MKKYLRPIVYACVVLFAAVAIYLVYNPPFAIDPPAKEPPYQAPAVSNRKLGGLVDREKNTRERIPPDISTKLPEAKDKKDVAALIGVIMDPKDTDAARNEAVNLLRRSGYKDLTHRLSIVLGNPRNGERFRSFCIQQLWMNLKGAKAAERTGIIAALHRALEDKQVKVRREALLALVREKDPRGSAAAVAWLTDASTADVRDLAIRCVKQLELKQHIPTVRKYLDDKNEPTRIAAIVALSQWGDQGSRPAFEKAAKSRVLRIRRAGEGALKRLDKAKADNR
jgi:HEAT repeat protein